MRRSATVVPLPGLLALIVVCAGLLTLLPLTSGPSPSISNLDVTPDSLSVGGPALSATPKRLPLHEGRHALPVGSNTASTLAALPAGLQSAIDAALDGASYEITPQRDHPAEDALYEAHNRAQALRVGFIAASIDADTGGNTSGPTYEGIDRHRIKGVPVVDDKRDTSIAQLHLCGQLAPKCVESVQACVAQRALAIRCRERNRGTTAFHRSLEVARQSEFQDQRLPVCLGPRRRGQGESLLDALGAVQIPLGEGRSMACRPVVVDALAGRDQRGIAHSMQAVAVAHPGQFHPQLRVRAPRRDVDPLGVKPMRRACARLWASYSASSAG